MYCSVRKINSHIVNVNALHKVVIMTEQAVNVPRCPIFLAMTKQLPVVALPSITKMAISFSVRNPNATANGKNNAQNNSNFVAVMPSVAGSLPFASCH